MADTIKPGTILIKEGALLPETLRFGSEPYVPGWRLVKDLDACGLDRKIRDAGWTFFCMAGQLGATVFGIDEQKTLSRAVVQILSRLESTEFNSLEIMRVATGNLETFPGSPLCDCLRPVKTYPGKRPAIRGQKPSVEAPRTIGCRLNQSIPYMLRTGFRRSSTRSRSEDFVRIVAHLEVTVGADLPEAVS